MMHQSKQSTNNPSLGHKEKQLAQADRNRVNLTIPDKLNDVIERCSLITGIPKTAIIMQAMVEGLPPILSRAEALEATMNPKQGGKNR